GWIPYARHTRTEACPDRTRDGVRGSIPPWITVRTSAAAARSSTRAYASSSSRSRCTKASTQPPSSGALMLLRRRDLGGVHDRFEAVQVPALPRRGPARASLAAIDPRAFGRSPTSSSHVAVDGRVHALLRHTEPEQVRAYVVQEALPRHRVQDHLAGGDRLGEPRETGERGAARTPGREDERRHPGCASLVEHAIPHPRDAAQGRQRGEVQRGRPQHLVGWL